MIILDTNVISETQKKRPNANVMAWLDAQDPTNLYLTAITVGEIVFGVSCLPTGARRTALETAIAAIIEEDFRGRVLPYDVEASRIYGAAIADARSRGQAIGMADGQIAAIVLANKGAAIATRDRKPFDALKVDIIDPWQAVRA